jgi:hypothetical protein
LASFFLPTTNGFTLLRRQQPNLMTHCLQLSAPLMRTTARFHAHLARRQVTEKQQYLATLERFAQHLAA